jgi:hypothetical protein
MHDSSSVRAAVMPGISRSSGTPRLLLCQEGLIGAGPAAPDRRQRPPTATAGNSR